MKRFFLSILSIFILFSCQKTDLQLNNDSNLENNNEKIAVSASIIPLSSIVNYIWDWRVNASSIIPAWVSPHWFDLKPNEVKNIVDSDLIVYLWLEHIDGFLGKIIDKKKNISLSQYVDLYNWFIDDDWDEHEESHNEWKESHEHEWLEHSVDPHIWTSPSNASIFAEKISEELSNLDSWNQTFYKEKLIEFNSELDKLIQNFKTSTSWKTPGSFIVFHDAYNYLFNEIGIPEANKNIFQKSVLNEMSINEIKALQDKVKEKNIKYIFREPQFNSANLEKFAKDNNLEILVLDPLWTDSSSGWYINNLSNNLKSLEKIYE